MSRSHYWRGDRVQIVQEPQAWLAYPNRYAVTPERANELKAEWRRLALLAHCDGHKPAVILPLPCVDERRAACR